MPTVFDGVPQLSNFDVGPGIAAYVQGRNQVRQDDSAQFEKAKEISGIVSRAAQLADTPEKWQTTIATLQKHFPSADLSSVQDFSARDTMLAQLRDPYKDEALKNDRARLDLERAKAKTTDAGPYAGNGMDAQNWNIILKGDPASPQYAAAYSQLFQTPHFTQGTDTDGHLTVTPIMPTVPPGVRQPGAPAAAPAVDSGSMGTPDAQAALAAKAVQARQGGGIAAPASAAPQAAASGAPTVGKPIVIGTAPLTDTQRTTALYSDRAHNANTIIDKFGSSGLDWTQPLIDQVPLFGHGFTTEDWQQLDQAERDFVNSVLRRESGASIQPSEFASAQKQYFPQPGDKPDVIARKAESRKTELNGLANGSGPAYRPPAAPPTSIKDDAGYAKLKSGAHFIGPDGVERVKP